MWQEFSKKSQQTLCYLVEKSIKEDRLTITLHRIEALTLRLQTDTDEELRLMKIFNVKGKQPLAEGSTIHPLSFLYDGLSNKYPYYGASLKN